MCLCRNALSKFSSEYISNHDFPLGTLFYPFPPYYCTWGRRRELEEIDRLFQLILATTKIMNLTQNLVFFYKLIISRPLLTLPIKRPVSDGIGNVFIHLSDLKSFRLDTKLNHFATFNDITDLSPLHLYP